MVGDRGVKERRETVRGQLRREGRRFLESPWLARWARWGSRALLGAVLAQARVLGGVSPWGVSLVAACGPGTDGFAGLLGAVFGYLVSRGLEEGLRYAATAILTFALAFALWDVSLYRRRWFMPLAAGVLDGVTGLVTLIRPTSSAFLALAGEMALTALGAWAFRGAFSLWEGREERGEPSSRQRLGLLGLGAAALISLAEVRVLGLASLGRICALGAAVAAGYTAGPGPGAVLGTAAGLAMDLAAGGGVVYAGLYSLAAVAAGGCRSRRRGLAASCALAALTLGAVWTGQGVGRSLLYEALAAVGVFLLLPQRVLRRLGLLLEPPRREDPAAWAMGEALGRLRAAAGVFRQIFETLRGLFLRPQPPGGEEDPSVIYDRAADRVCARCVLRERCWQTDYQDTYDLLNHALPTLLEGGAVTAAMFPQRFRDRCVRFSDFLAAVGEERTAYRLRRQYKAQVAESRRAVCGQYEEVAKLMEETVQTLSDPLTVDPRRTRKLRQFLAGRELSCQGFVCLDGQGRLRVCLEGEDARQLRGELGQMALSGLLEVPLAPPQTPKGGQLLFRQWEPLTAVAGVAGRRRKGQRLTGDAGAWFKDDRGILFLLLCDGMGSGPQAGEDSRLTLRLLEQFLRAGVSPEIALGTVNQALALRGEETGSFSTVDLMTLDLYSGQGVLYKLGAAPSYLKRGGTVSRLTAQTLPAGLRGASGPDKPSRAAFRLSPGDCLVLLTDGVLTGEDDWLRAALAAFDGDSPTQLAEELVSRDAAGEDDKTALVLRLGLRAGLEG